MQVSWETVYLHGLKAPQRLFKKKKKRHYSWGRETVTLRKTNLAQSTWRVIGFLLTSIYHLHCEIKHCPWPKNNLGHPSIISTCRLCEGCLRSIQLPWLGAQIRKVGGKGGGSLRERLRKVLVEQLYSRKHKYQQEGEAPEAVFTPSPFPVKNGGGGTPWAVSGSLGRLGEQCLNGIINAGIKN